MSKSARSARRFAVVSWFVMLLALAGVSPSSSADWAEIDGVLGLGITELTLEEPVWLAIQPQLMAAKGLFVVFSIDINGRDGSALELWSVIFHEGSTTRFDLLNLLNSQEITDGTASFQWTQAESGALWVDPGGVGPTPFTFTVEVIATPPENDVLVIPAVAHAPGKHGSFFRSDVRIFNQLPVESGMTQDVRLVLTPSDGGPEHEAEVTVQAGHVVALRDVVFSVFGLENTTGALRVEVPRYSGDLLHVVSRTYHRDEAGGTWGQFVPAQRWQDAAGPSDTNRILLHLEKSEDFRSNVGFVEVLGLDAEIELEMFDDTGATVAAGNLSVPAGTHRQVNDVFGFLGAPAAPNASLQVRVANSGRVFSYASVVDNRTSDPIFIPGFDPKDSEIELTVSAAAAADGVAGSRWRTDVRVLPSGEPTAVRVSFLPDDGSPEISAVFPFAGRGVLAIDDVVGRLGAHGSGALHLSKVDENTIQFLHVTSRTYNLTEEGTYGQFIAAEDDLDAHFQSGSVIGIDGSSDFRSNFGMANTSSADTVRVEVILVSENGIELGSGIWVVPPRSHRQINNVFAALGVTPRENCRIDFIPESSDPNATVHIYASVINNRTGDAVYIPARFNHWIADHQGPNPAP